MRKFLSLVLALVMMMSLITINTSAVEFKDGEDIVYDEAVDVISTIHVVDGYPDGGFGPKGNLSRGAAAKIICNLILGPTTASQLHADTAPFRDVPVNHDFAGYIAYCQKEGIISGYGDGNFYPAGSLSGNAFMKMLLGALGYDAEIEQYVGPNWTINVAKRAIGIGLDKGLTDGVFDGSRLVTREEAALYAFNTLQADLVEYSSKITANVNGAEVTVGNSLAESRKWDSQRTRVNYIRDDDIIQFAEEYFNKLEKKPDTDDFERPAHTWLYDKDTIGTYVEWELMLEEYTAEVTGRDLYDLITKTQLDNNDLVYYVDGKIPDANHPMATNPAIYTQYALTAANDYCQIDRTDLVRSNTSGVGISDNGVLTQVFLDKDKQLITIVSIDTWLAQASADYSEDKEYAPVDVFTGITGTTTGRNKKTDSYTWNVDVEDVPGVVDVKDDDMFLVNISFKDEVGGVIVAMEEPEVLEESTVTKYSNKNENIVDKLTVDGTEYKHARRAFYSDDALDMYDNTLLTDKTYDVYMDPYGYAIGVALHEGDDNYVFITAFDRPTSNRAISTAKADGIFLDGTMIEMTVNVTDTNKNIRTANTNTRDSYQYFIEWNVQQLPGNDGCYRYNRWFTYSVNEDGVYTLNPATRMNAHKYAVATDPYNIRTSDLYVDDNVYVNATNPYGMSGLTWNNPAVDPVPTGTTNNNYESGRTLPVYTDTKNERSYANDDSVFLTVDLDDTDTSGGARAITEVTGVYTGVENVEMEVPSETNAQEAEIYTVYDADHYIIGAIVIGEANGGNANVAYVLSGAKSEERKDGVYYWEFEAVLDGEIKTLTARSKFTDIFDTINAENQGNADGTATNNGNDGLVELRFDSDGYVVSVKPVKEEKIYSFYGDRNDATGVWGGNSIAGAGTGSSTVLARTSAPVAAANGKLDIRDAKAYRIGAIGNYWNEDANGTVHVGVAGNAAGVHHYYDSAPEKLTLAGRTLYVTDGQKDEGLFLASDAKAIVIQDENNKTNVKTEWSSVDQALKHLAGVNPATGVNGNPADSFAGEVIAAIGSNGAAKWVVFKSYSTLYTGSNTGSTGTSRLTALTNASYTYGTVTVTLNGSNLKAGETFPVEIEQLVPGTGEWVKVSTTLYTSAVVTPGTSETVTISVTLSAGWQYRVAYNNRIYAYFGV